MRSVFSIPELCSVALCLCKLASFRSFERLNRLICTHLDPMYFICRSRRYPLCRWLLPFRCILPYRLPKSASKSKSAHDWCWLRALQPKLVRPSPYQCACQCHKSGIVLIGHNHVNLALTRRQCISVPGSLLYCRADVGAFSNAPEVRL